MALFTADVAAGRNLPLERGADSAPLQASALGWRAVGEVSYSENSTGRLRIARAGARAKPQ